MDFGRAHLIGVLADILKFGCRWNFQAPCPVGVRGGGNEGLDNIHGKCPEIPSTLRLVDTAQ